MSMDTSLLAAYGSYKVPEIIVSLHTLDKHFLDRGFSMDLISFRLANSYFPYSITPPDLIPIADTGGAGIHFGFLTDFGRVKHLEDAPIVCVTPTDDPPLRLVARNIVEFMDLIVSVPHAECLEAWWPHRDGDQPPETYETVDDDAPQSLRLAYDEIHSRLKQELGAANRPVLPYLRETMNERAQSSVLSTLDGLGIIGNALVHGEHYAFQPHAPQDEAELQRMTAYFEAASSIEAKLAFIRDINYMYVHNQFDAPSPVFELLKQFMMSMGLYDEVTRMFDIRPTA
ncbi:hypothetical protein [Paenibacillus lemnae]|uniref:Uncharacterized protein n=1 Tax=Paenibacillus lemnae TaxID=1330551 RepID=A0A848M744_PAELE|nr:hypothetical protein [Paenibacillus lemnae]NMO96456.1 hypothetical protein [Paenibacillus lemnae]